MDSICILLGIKLYQREYLEYKMLKKNGFSYFSDGWNYVDLIGISSLFGCCIMGLIANFTSYNNYIKFFSNTFCFRQYPITNNGLKCI